MLPVQLLTCGLWLAYSLVLVSSFLLEGLARK